MCTADWRWNSEQSSHPTQTQTDDADRPHCQRSYRINRSLTFGIFIGVRSIATYNRLSQYLFIISYLLGLSYCQYPGSSGILPWTSLQPDFFSGPWSCLCHCHFILPLDLPRFHSPTGRFCDYFCKRAGGTCCAHPPRSVPTFLYSDHRTSFNLSPNSSKQSQS